MEGWDVVDGDGVVEAGGRRRWRRSVKGGVGRQRGGWGGGGVQWLRPTGDGAGGGRLWRWRRLANGGVGRRRFS